MKKLLKLILIFFILFDSNAFYIEFDNNIKDVIKNLKYRNVGPTRGGRVTTVHGVESQKNVFYMGTTGGGVWKTTDFGNNWFNTAATLTLPFTAVGELAPFAEKADIIFYINIGNY